MEKKEPLPMKNSLKMPIVMSLFLLLSACSKLALTSSLASVSSAAEASSAVSRSSNTPISSVYGAMPSSEATSVTTSSTDPLASSEEVLTQDYNIIADFGSVTSNAYTILWDYIVPFFSWSDYGIVDDFVPGDTFVMSFKGELSANMTFPVTMNTSAFTILSVTPTRKTLLSVDQAALKAVAANDYPDAYVITSQATKAYETLTDFLASTTTRPLYAVKDAADKYQWFFSDVPSSRLPE